MALGGEIPESSMLTPGVGATASSLFLSTMTMYLNQPHKISAEHTLSQEHMHMHRFLNTACVYIHTHYVHYVHILNTFIHVTWIVQKAISYFKEPDLLI